MAKKKKSFELRPIEESKGVFDEKVEVVRLDADKDELGISPVQRLELPVDPEAESRLVLPTRDLAELRTHQPGVDAIMDNWVPVAAKQTEDEWGGEAKSERKIPWGWFALIVIVVGAGVLWSLTQVQKAQEQVQTSVKKTQALKASDQVEELDATRVIEEIEHLIKSYYGAESPAELLSFVRHPDRVKPLMDHYYAHFPYVKADINFTDLLQPITLGNRANFWLTVVISKDQTKRTTLLEIMPDGRAKMDWETAVNYQPMPWDEFVENRLRDVSLDFRIDATQDNLYTHEFVNQDEWICFQLSAYESVLVAYGYAKKDSEIAKQMLAIISKNDNQSTSMMLRLRIPKDLKSRQGMLIEKVVNDRWIFVDPPKEEQNSEKSTH
ncbi:MAG: hypothetical protein EAZ42_06880 [Verrucomicrobia bacterium]|nr:MAG: hypothetical protein EAZ42_06880 [Verrucomicrobiota bacterium]